MTRPDPLDVALSLASAGWYVFPVNSDPKADKRPFVNWNDAATTDPETIATWWSTDYPTAYVGVHTGRSGLVVVDIDEKNGKSGSDNLLEAGHDLDGYIADGVLMYSTPSGGSHMVYRAPAGVDLTIAQNHPVEAVDIRSGNGFAVYYGQPFDGAPALAPAPDWAIVKKRSDSVARGGPSDVQGWLSALRSGKPDSDVKAARKAVTAQGMSHGDMLTAVTRLVQLGAEGRPGVADALDRARTTYCEDYPDSARHWDAAVEGSVARYGKPPVTFALTKAEKKTIAARAEGKAAAAAAAPQPGEASHANDLEVATEVTELLSGSWIYIMNSGLYRYNGRVWEATERLALEDATSQVLRSVVRREIRRVYNTEGLDERARKTLAGQWATYLNAGKIAAVARLVTGQMGERQLALDSHPDLLNVQNGVVDLRTKELLPHDPAYLFTKIAGAEYQPGATSKLWRAALKAFQSKATRDYMQVRLGQAATGHSPDDHKIAFLHGSGSNGKSTVLDGCVSALGSYSTKVDKSLLLGNASAHPTVFMDLKGARFAYFEEPPGESQLNIERIKDLAGTKEIKGRYMGEDFQTFRATHSLMGSTNHQPKVFDTDDGAWRRLMLVSFPWKYTEPHEEPTRANERKGDPRLKDAFETPNAAVLSWLVDGAHEWYSRGQVMPEAPRDVKASTASWRANADQVLAFTSEHLELASGYAIPVAYLYSEFRSFLKQQGRQEWSDETIRDRMFQHQALPDVERAKVREGRNWTYSKPPLVLLNGRGPNPSAPNWCYLGVRFKTEDDKKSVETDAIVTPIGKRAKR